MQLPSALLPIPAYGPAAGPRTVDDTLDAALPLVEPVRFVVLTQTQLGRLYGPLGRERLAQLLVRLAEALERLPRDGLLATQQIALARIALSARAYAVALRRWAPLSRGRLGFGFTSAGQAAYASGATDPVTILTLINNARVIPPQA